MKNYIFTAIHSSTGRGYNRTVKVWRIKNNQPIFIGYDDEISTSGYKGDYACACKIISEHEGHKMDKTGYRLLSKNIRLFEV